ncbi:MAG: hybrid sensor histidine kinase/response regulator, partial [Desulfobacterales bacterium]|nr:hybrid sensor histidine kinase/response regulator [Desulfobacterales bacterium]
TGLGLAVVLGIVEDHDGWINVASEPGRGTCAHVYLPVLRETDSIEETEKEEIEIQGGTECIMVVDDEASILEFYTALLTAYGYQVVTFSDGLTALRAFEENPNSYDLLVTDMTMPEMSGDVLARKILKTKENFPIILSTGYNDRISNADALKAGIKAYLPKPLEGETLLSTIRNLLDG